MTTVVTDVARFTTAAYEESGTRGRPFVSVWTTAVIVLSSMDLSASIAPSRGRTSATPDEPSAARSPSSTMSRRRWIRSAAFCRSALGQCHVNIMPEEGRIRNL
jgi:hypothetical protein